MQRAFNIEIETLTLLRNQWINEALDFKFNRKWTLLSAISNGNCTSTQGQALFYSNAVIAAIVGHPFNIDQMKLMVPTVSDIIHWLHTCSLNAWESRMLWFEIPKTKAKMWKQKTYICALRHLNLWMSWQCEWCVHDKICENYAKPKYKMQKKIDKWWAPPQGGESERCWARQMYRLIWMAEPKWMRKCGMNESSEENEI